MALVGSWLAERNGVGSILIPLTVVQGLGFLAAFLIHEEGKAPNPSPPPSRPVKLNRASLSNDPVLWAFVAAMLLFHAANAPGGVFLGLFLNRDLHAPERLLAYAFVDQYDLLDDRRLAGGMAGRPLGPPTAFDRGVGSDGIATGARGSGAITLASDRQPGARRRRKRDVRGAGRRVGDRSAGRLRALGRSPGDRRVMPGARLGDRPGGMPACWSVHSATEDSLPALAGVGVVATAIVVFLVPETLAGSEAIGVSCEAVDLSSVAPSDLSIVS